MKAFLNVWYGRPIAITSRIVMFLILSYVIVTTPGFEGWVLLLLMMIWLQGEERKDG